MSKFKVGDKVKWMESTKRGTGFRFSQKEGTVAIAYSVYCEVKLRNGRITTVFNGDLRLKSEKGQVTELFETLAGREIGKQ